MYRNFKEFQNLKKIASFRPKLEVKIIIYLKKYYHYILLLL
jgi:hypothetical protein